MSQFAQAVLDATFTSVMADRARVTPSAGGAAFEVRVFQIEPDEVLGGGLQMQPIMGVRVLDVRKSEWAQPAIGDQVDLLSDIDGSVTQTLSVVDEPLSVDGKRLTWSVNCAES